MPLSIDSALGILPEALTLRARRAEILAANLANADTPNYKARDFNFDSALAQAQAGTGQLPLTVTHAGQIQPANSIAPGVPLEYRVPTQPSLDGNTVDSQREQAAFSRNAVDYQTTLAFLSGRIKGLMSAIKGD